MGKVAIVYWSGTGNTKEMAKQIENGIKEAGGEAVLIQAEDFKAEYLDDYQAIAFGCPSMGAETLEENDFEPMFTSCESSLQGRKLLLFGSYGWGDGEWMRDWTARCENTGAVLICESIIANETPDADACAACKEAGKKLAAV